MSRPKIASVTRIDYCQYLLSTQINYTLTNYDEHVDEITHDTIYVKWH